MSGAVTEEPRCGLARRAIRGLFVEAGDSPSQYFYPRDRLRGYLTRSKVDSILQCSCPNCRRHYASFGRDHAPTEFIDRIVGPESDAGAMSNPARTAYSLFGLLICIEHPMLIIGFMMREYYDIHLLPVTFRSLKSMLNEFFEKEGSDAFKQFEHDFNVTLRHFAIPVMDSGAYSVYGKDTILPFLKHNKVRSQGANSSVYAFEIYGEYRKFSDASDVTKFARKELDKDSELAFHLENKNLNVAETLQDDHIVRMIKAYKHGDTFNLIFPYAKANLDNLLRDAQSDLVEAVPGPVESRHVWKQLLGIAKALDKIGGPRGTNSLFGQHPRPEHRGVHFDLKPANILIDDKNVWKISDFGQAVFRPTSDSSSRVVNQGGTLAYAPPEMDNIDAKSSRRYDIWSLGCITLEVLAFALLGPRGLKGCDNYKGLDQVRCSSSSSSGREDNALWYREGDRDEYRVKPAVLDFMRFLETTESLQQRPSSLSFVNRTLDVIKKMLKPIADDRIDIGEVIRLLESAIEESNEDKQEHQMVAGPGETSIGEPELQCIQPWHLRHQQWKLAKIGVFEDAQSNLRICTVASHVVIQEYLKRARVQLVPAYAFYDPFAPSSSEDAIYFSDLDRSVSKYVGSIFSFTEEKGLFHVPVRLYLEADDPGDALTMQEQLTGHTIEANFAVKNMKYRRHKSFSQQFSHFIRRREDEEDGLDLGAGRVQLWVERTGSDLEARQNSLLPVTSPTRPVRIQPHQRADYRVVPPRRLVLFIHKLRAFITILGMSSPYTFPAMTANEEHPVDKNWFEDPTDLSPTTMRFIPRKASRDPSFTASFFRPPDFQEQGTYPGVPLCPQILRSMEQQSGFVSELVEVELTFEDEDKRLSMSRKFLTVKTEWKNKTKELEKQPGYTPVFPPMNHSIPLPMQDHTPRHNKRSKSPWSFLGKRTSNSTTTNPIANGFNTSTTITERAVPPQTSVPANPRLPSQWRPDPHRGGGRGGAQHRKKASNASSQPSQGSNEDEDD
ncbi:hypothetical protein LTR06_007902 [Exophiala xenobiotica]|nr:hypothetical protein LTR06_007902 [Exophiala xenobiotica]